MVEQPDPGSSTQKALRGWILACILIAGIILTSSSPSLAPPPLILAATPPQVRIAVYMGNGAGPLAVTTTSMHELMLSNRAQPNSEEPSAQPFEAL